MLIYCYYNSDTSKQVMHQITLEGIVTKRGAATEYLWCISVNVQKGGCHQVPVVYQCKCKCTYLVSINFDWFLFLVEYILSSRYVFSYVICFRIIHSILISTAHVLFLTCLPVSISGTSTGLQRDICQKCSRLLLKTQVPKIVNLPTEPYFL